ncbi:nucleoside monophosphate kinase [Candidatus Saccharibacteria bacterium]|nr:nucleoside monophosphate kinase [Candidatus Saccharibacteria bacterium]
MEEKIDKIKEWLGTGSVNIFGLPMSGKDTQGVKLAEAIGGKFLSSGMIIRVMEKEKGENYSETGELIPTNVFYEWVLPYFERADLFEYPLVLSSIGRWHGEEKQVMSVAAGAGHDIKAVIALNISEEEAKRRFDEAKVLNDRGDRDDDKDIETFETRLREYREKTLPVLQYYKVLGLLTIIDGEQSREEVFNELVEKLYEKALKSGA